MNRITRRWCLLAMAGVPVALGITLQALSVRLDGDYLRISAPNLDFLTGKPLERLKDGHTVGYLGQLAILVGNERMVQGRAVARFAFSYDVWSKGFKATLLSGTRTNPSARNLTREAAQSWCLDQLKINLAQVPTDRPFWIRLEMRSEDSNETAGIVGEPGISINAVIEFFSHPVKNQQVHLDTREIGPFNIADLRRARL